MWETLARGEQFEVGSCEYSVDYERNMITFLLNTTKRWTEEEHGSYLRGEYIPFESGKTLTLKQEKTAEVARYELPLRPEHYAKTFKEHPTVVLGTIGKGSLVLYDAQSKRSLAVWNHPRRRWYQAKAGLPYEALPANLLSEYQRKMAEVQGLHI
jgi:hypothetical protein